MTYDMNNLFGDLDDKNLKLASDANPHKAIAQEQAQRFPCMSCAGTGTYKGVRVHQPESKCFACGAKGWHKKNHYEAMKDKRERKAKAAETRIRNIRNAIDGFARDHAEADRAIREHASWNNFCQKLLSELVDGKVPGARAIEIVMDIDAKSKARDAARQAEKEAKAIEVDYSLIHKMFDKARESGLKRISYRAEGFVMTPASQSSKNPGAIYVKRADGGAYLGKVISGKFHAGYGVTPVDVEKMQTIARDPLEAAKAYGKLMGSCSCCGRRLTDHASISLGIGPICAEKWGLMGSDSMPHKEAEAIRKAGREKQRALATKAVEETMQEREPVEITDVKNSPKSVAGKYDAFYTADMTPAQKKALRAKLRKEKRP